VASNVGNVYRRYRLHWGEGARCGIPEERLAVLQNSIDFFWEVAAAPPSGNVAILQMLATHRVDLLVVGGVAAVLQGAPVSTFDLDLVHSREASDVLRILGALHDLDAV
jgi:hypothetical protein